MGCVGWHGALTSGMSTHKSGQLLKSIRNCANTTIRGLSALISPEVKVLGGRAAITGRSEVSWVWSQPTREAATCLGCPPSRFTQHTPGALVLLILCPDWAHCLEHPFLLVPTGGCVVPGQVWI